MDQLWMVIKTYHLKNMFFMIHTFLKWDIVTDDNDSLIEVSQRAKITNTQKGSFVVRL